LAKFPLLGEAKMDIRRLALANEFHMTNDSHLFSTSPGPLRLPLYEGKMIHQFDCTLAEPRYWIEESEGRRALLGREGDVGQALAYNGYRLAFRRIGRGTDARTMIATVLPRRVFASESLDVASGLGASEMVGLVGLLNSFVLDYTLRQRVAANISMFFVYQLPVPLLVGPKAEAIVERSLKLICIDEGFADLWKEVMGTPWTPDVAVTDTAERARLRAELDGIVAHFYSLSGPEFSYLLTTFPVVHEEVKLAALAAYRAFSPRPGDPQILGLIEQGESTDLEFKSTVRWDLREGKKSQELEAVIRHTIAGFLNAQGGTLLIGVADDGSIVGLQHDYWTLKKQNRDGFELFLTDLLLGGLGKDMATSIRATFHEVEGKDICRVMVAAGPRPVYLKEGNDEAFYLRAGNSTRRLSTREAVDYCRAHWK